MALCSSCGKAHGSEPCVGEDEALAVGARLGEYVIQHKVTVGGMGTIYAAIHPTIAKKAAIKVISQSLCRSRDAVLRFVQEARAVNQIGHPNIVDVFSFGTLPDGRPYFAMEWLRGQTLADRLQRGPLPLDEAAAILDQICRGLEAAHGAGIIHRDLKPDNIFLVAMPGERPLVKLLDFGLAKLVGEPGQRAHHTRTGAMLGTPLYISPEQARGFGVEPATDIYALGVMAFEILLARLPFLADNVMDVVAMHLYTPPPDPRSLWPDIPEPLDRLLRGMLAKEAAERPSLREIRAALAELAADLTPAGRAPGHAPLDLPPRPFSLRLPLRAALVGLASSAVVGLGGLGFALARHSRPVPSALEARAALALPAAPAPSTAPAPVPTLAAPAPLPTLPAELARETPRPEAARTRGVILIAMRGGAARILLDGRLIAGAASSARIPVDAGRHALVFAAPGGIRIRQAVEVAAGATVEVPVALPRAPARVRHASTTARANRQDAGRRRLSEDAAIDPFPR